MQGSCLFGVRASSLPLLVRTSTNVPKKEEGGCLAGANVLHIAGSMMVAFAS